MKGPDVFLEGLERGGVVVGGGGAGEAAEDDRNGGDEGGYVLVKRELGRCLGRASECRVNDFVLTGGLDGLFELQGDLRAFADRDVVVGVNVDA